MSFVVLLAHASAADHLGYVSESPAPECDVSMTGPRRESRQDLGVCRKVVLALLLKHPQKYVTAGWVEDRVLVFNEHTIAIVLRKMANESRIDHKFETGFQLYAFRTDLAAVLRERGLRRKKLSAAPAETD